MTEGSPVMRGELRRHNGWVFAERCGVPSKRSTPRPHPVDADQGQMMRRGRSVTDKLYPGDCLGQLVGMPEHGRLSQEIVEMSVETGRHQPFEPCEVLGLSVQRDRSGEHPHECKGDLLLVV